MCRSRTVPHPTAGKESMVPQMRPQVQPHHSTPDGENAALRKLDAKNTRREQENQLRKEVATWSLWFVLTQLVITNTTIVAYIVTMLVLKQYVPTEVLITWLSSTIVEIVGILWVIARSLFPFHDRHRDTKGEKHKS